MKFISGVTDAKAGVDTTNLVEIGSGTTVKEINAQLWAQGKALPVLGGFDGQTLGGVLPTGTHGSVLKAGSLGGASTDPKPSRPPRSCTPSTASVSYIPPRTMIRCRPRA